MIALFDSGLGGLSVLREVRALLPGYGLRYFADSAFCPYGPRPIEQVRARSLAIGRWLTAQGAQLIVVACNTATSAAIEALRAELAVPIVGMEPGLKPAVAASHTGRVGVLATSGTLAGQRFAALVERFAANVEVVTQPCPGLVEQVERGDLAGPRTRALVREYVAALLARQVDTIILGCTHYPFVRPLIAEAAGPEVALIDTGPAVARQVARQAEQHAVRPGAGDIRCYTTGDPAAVAPPLQTLLGEAAPVEPATLEPL